MAFKNTRIWQLGRRFVIIHSPRGWFTNYPARRPVRRAPRGHPPNAEANNIARLSKARTKVRRLIETHGLYYHATLTFEENMQDIVVADKRFRKFIGRLRKQYENIKYIAGRAFQERGAVHYHMVINSYVGYQQLGELWRQGHVSITHPRERSREAARRLANYLLREANDIRLRGKKAYLSSKGLRLFKRDELFDGIEEVKEHLAAHGQVTDEFQTVHFEDTDTYWIG